jgi:hypothetical protein
LEKISENQKSTIIEGLKKIDKGERDVRFWSFEKTFRANSWKI